MSNCKKNKLKRGFIFTGEMVLYIPKKQKPSLFGGEYLNCLFKVNLLITFRKVSLRITGVHIQSKPTKYLITFLKREQKILTVFYCNSFKNDTPKNVYPYIQT